MTRYILVRGLQGLLSLLAVTFIIFGIARLTGDPVLVLLPPEASLEQVETLRRNLGLDRPIYVQYFAYLGDIAQGDLGTSIQTKRPVSELIAQRLPATLQLGGAALLLSIVIGVPLGMYSAYFRGGLLDRGTRFLAVLGQSAPTFWVGLILILLVAIQWNLLPPGGRATPLHIVLPAFTMAWRSLAGITRLMRSSLLETLEMDYIRFSRAKGMSERNVMWKHGLRNAALPVLTFGGVLAAGLVTGSVVTEAVFVWPGTGRLLLDAVTARDFPVVQGVVLSLAAVYVFVSLTVDLLYAYLNPRLRAG